MPFTIALPKDSKITAQRLVSAIDRHLESSRFTAGLEIVASPARAYGSGIVVRPVRLRQAKPYCGQHPGECQVPFGGADRPKRKARYLEWEDWVEFNGVLNDVMDKLGVKADAWSVPMEAIDKGKKMYIRRIENGRRHRYEWEEEYRGDLGGRSIRIWNHGTPDQFVQE
jgi:hypothetical protein